MKFGGRITLRTKLFLVMLFALAVSFTILLAFTLSSVEQFITSEIQQQLKQNLAYVSSHMQQRADQTILSLSQPASASPVRERIAAADRKWLADAVNRWHDILPFLDRVCIVDPHFRLIASHGDSFAPDEVNQFKGQLAAAFASNAPSISTELYHAGEKIITTGDETFAAKHFVYLSTLVIIPVVDAEKNTLGAIVTVDFINNDKNYLDGLQPVLGPDVVVGISQQGQVIAETSPLAEGHLTSGLMSQLERGKTFMGLTRLGGREYQALSSPIFNSRQEFAGAITVALSPDRYLAMRHSNQQNILLSMLLGSLVSFAIAFWAAKRLTDPLTQLTKGVLRLQEGDLDSVVTVGTDDEFSLLATTFNRFVETLRERNQTIFAKAKAMEGLNEQLEARVAERTAEIESQSRLQQEILSSMVEGIIVLDNHEQVILCNSAAAEILELNGEVSLGVPLEQLSRKGSFTLVREQVATLLEKGGKLVVSFTVSGKCLKANMASVLNEEGRVMAVVISIRDVTVEETVDQMKNEFITTVSHELKTPLTSIKGALHFILGKCKWLTDTERELLDICSRNTDRLIRLIAGILDISKIEAGGMEFVFKPLVPGELAIYAVEELRGLAMSRKVAVVNTVDADLPLIEGDHDRLIQVLSNLLANAIKYSDEGKVVKVTAYREGAKVVFSLQDMNRTIPESERGKLFKKFQQIDPGGEGRLGGSGLGLAICKEIVVRHKGEISYRPLFAGGNEFYFSIPIYGGEE